MTFDIPAIPANPTQKFWSVFCFDGKRGLRGLVPLNKIG
jgi:hypothetical protein